MATNLLPPFNPTLTSSVDTGHNALKSSLQPSSTNWWAPLFGWPSDPGYLDSSTASSNILKLPDKISHLGRTEAETRTEKSSRLRPIQFTEEKARMLRMMTTDAGSFHHEMYHSAIAARLASDFGNRSQLRGQAWDHVTPRF